MRLIIILTFFLIQTSLIGQTCSSTKHSTNKNDSWISCTVSDNPNILRGNSHWVMYDLGFIYNLGSTHFWNYNVINEVENGMKNIVIDYSIDGTEWFEAQNFTLPMATGSSDYMGSSGPNLGGIDARYVLLTCTETWGGPCAGISEVRFDIESNSSIPADVFADDDEIVLYPNPTTGLFVIRGQLTNYQISILNVQGVEVEELETEYNQTVIDIHDLPNGLYFVSIRNTNTDKLCMKKILKHN